MIPFGGAWQCARCIIGDCKCDLLSIRKQMFRDRHNPDAWKNSFPENDPDGSMARAWHRQNAPDAVTIIHATAHCQDCTVGIYGLQPEPLTTPPTG